MNAPPTPRLRHRAPTDPALTLAKLRDVVSDHCGIITQLRRYRVQDPHARGLYGYGATVETATVLGYAPFRARRAEETEIWRTGAQGRDGNRVAFDRTRAFVRAVGEALERYASCTYDPTRFVESSAETLGADALDVRRMQRPSPQEYAGFTNVRPFDPQAPMRWVWAWRLPDGKPQLVPAQFAYVMYNCIPGESLVMATTSTGCALHHTFEEAIHAGLREIVERDSFFITWLHRLQVPRLDLDSVDDPFVRRFAQQVHDDGARLVVLVTTTDLGIPSFAVAIADRRAGEPAFTLTLGAHPDPRKGLRQAIEEAAMMRLDTRLRVRLGAIEAPERMQDIQRMSEHGDFYLRQENLGPVEWLLAPGPTVRLDELATLKGADPLAEIHAMVDAIAKAGHETLFVDTTPDDLREAGWCAVKVLVPGTVRHDYGYGVRYLDCPRLYEAPVRMGHRATPPTQTDINLDAHPYS